ncbi:MAG TPA: EAL domain-containing protein [Acidimicrobiales bacterium]|nr:EAL domain-containing protein [Acidimicrobiales bacterium]
MTLTDLPAPGALAVIATLLALSWAAAYFLGGGTVVAPHWFYVPVFLAGLRFGRLGAFVTAVISMFLAGPLLPADVATHAPQALSDWVSRGIFFVLIGLFVTELFGAVRQMAAREANIIESQRLAAAQADGLRESEQRFRSLIQRATDMIAVVDPDGSLLYESPAVEELFGWRLGERLSQPALEFVHPDDRERAAAALAETLANPATPLTIELRHRDSSGVWHWVEATVSNMLDEPTVRGIVVNGRVVDERKVLEHELIQRALHDPLTGLANRVLLRERLESALVRRDRSARRPALLFIDIDDFKTVNDGFGHDAGDRMLIEVGSRLRAAVRPEDLVARLGGDEFAVLIEEGDQSRTVAADVATRILEALQPAFDVAGNQIHVRASIGIASYRDGSPDADLILRQADIAMYDAKANGKARYATFSDEMDELVQHRLGIESGLRSALREDQIFVAYQPIVALATRQVEAVEALVRWQHPTRGLLSPAAFLDVAEETGLIIPLGRQVLRQACRQLRLWRESLAPEMRVSVNLSAAQLHDASIVDDVGAALEEAGLPAEALILELTEDSLISDVSGAAVTLDSLRSLGVSLAIDDFGTGYSSLSHLRHFPVDIIKVDKSFVDGVCGSTEEATLTRAVLAIGEEFCLQVVAEGVESDDQDVELRRLGCKYGQGFLYARPMAPEAVEHLLRDGAQARPALELTTRAP